MMALSKYWSLVSVERTGRGKIEEMASLKTYVQQQFPDWALADEGSDLAIQRQLLTLARQEAAAWENWTTHPASLCLRCFISHQIQRSCSQLAAQFGSDHGFTQEDLLPYVLLDQWSLSADLSPRCTSEEDGEEIWGPLPAVTGALGVEILQTFNPDRSSLAAWTNRRVRQDRELTQFLLEHGVYLVSDWAILNDTTVAQLARVLAEFHQLPVLQIQQFQALLGQYHQIYRQAHLQNRQAGGRGQCPLPTAPQLDQMAQNLRPQWGLSSDQVLSQLQTLAELLRQYRIYVRGGLVVQDSLDDPALPLQVEDIPAPSPDELEQAQQEFLTIYQQQLVQCLDQAIAQVLRHRLDQLQQKQPDRAQQFLQGLHLFHCQGLVMGEIAPLLELAAQYQVTRLLRLKALRADVRRAMLDPLRQEVMQVAIAYTTPEQLVYLDRQIAAALDEQVAGLIAAAELEGSRPRGQPLTNLFARRLCEHLETLKPFL